MHKTYEFLHCPTTLKKSFGDIDYIIANHGKGGWCQHLSAYGDFCHLLGQGALPGWSHLGVPSDKK